METENKVSMLPAETIPPELLNPEVMMWFGQMLMQSFAPKKQYTVSEWIDYVITTKECTGRKKKTINGYRYCAERIKEQLGNKLLSEVRPSDISELFIILKKDAVRLEIRAVQKEANALAVIMKNQGFSKTRLSKVAKIAESTVDRAVKGERVLWPKAEAICSVLGVDPHSLFDEIHIEKKLSNDTLDGYWRFVSLVFSVAVRELQIPYNPVLRAEKSHHKRKIAETLQPEEVQKVLDATAEEPIDKRCLIHLFLITGGRRGEIAGLRWSRINWNQATILIDHEVLYTPTDGVYVEDSTKTGQDRILRLPKETLELLLEYRKWQEQHRKQIGDRWVESDYIFTGKYGGRIHPDTISGYIVKFEKKYNLPHIYPHKFRHTMASILIYSGIDPVTVSKRLGHAQVSTTQNIYAHLIRKADMESAECIADAIFRNKKVV